MLWDTPERSHDYKTAKTRLPFYCDCEVLFLSLPLDVPNLTFLNGHIQTSRVTPSDAELDCGHFMSQIDVVAKREIRDTERQAEKKNFANFCFSVCIAVYVPVIADVIILVCTKVVVI